MTQKGQLFKGNQKKAPAANRHGKIVKVKKGKFEKQPKNKSKEFLAGKEVTKFINSANEAKIAAVAAKDGAPFSLINAPPPTGGNKGPKGKKQASKEG